MSHEIDPISDAALRTVRELADIHDDHEARDVCDVALGLAIPMGSALPAAAPRPLFDRAAARHWAARFASFYERTGIEWTHARARVPLAAIALAMLLAAPACVTPTAAPPPDASAPPPPDCGAPPARDELLTFAPTRSTWRDGTAIVIFRTDRYERHVEWMRAAIAWSDCARGAL